MLELKIGNLTVLGCKRYHRREACVPVAGVTKYLAHPKIFQRKQVEIEGNIPNIYNKNYFEVFFYPEYSTTVSKNNLRWFKCKFLSKLSLLFSLQKHLGYAHARRVPSPCNMRKCK